MRAVPKTRSEYKHFMQLATRWMDNDVYGHVNNVVYYSWFDTAVNEFLIRNHVLTIETSPVVGLVIETQCNYFSPLVFPDRISVGIVVAELGNSSVRYEVGIFREGEDTAAAQGHFVHVYVDRISRRPVAIPAAMRALLNSIRAEKND